MRGRSSVVKIHRPTSYTDGDAEIARTDITRPDNAAPDSKGGHRETGQRETISQRWTSRDFQINKVMS